LNQESCLRCFDQYLLMILNALLICCSSNVEFLILVLVYCRRSIWHLIRQVQYTKTKELVIKLKDGKPVKFNALPVFVYSAYPLYKNCCCGALCSFEAMWPKLKPRRERYFYRYYKLYCTWLIPNLDGEGVPQRIDEQGDFNQITTECINVFCEDSETKSVEENMSKLYGNNGVGFFFF